MLPFILNSVSNSQVINEPVVNYKTGHEDDLFYFIEIIDITSKLSIFLLTMVNCAIETVTKLDYA